MTSDVYKAVCAYMSIHGLDERYVPPTAAIPFVCTLAWTVPPSVVRPVSDLLVAPMALASAIHTLRARAGDSTEAADRLCRLIASGRMSAASVAVLSATNDEAVVAAVGAAEAA